jgi:hypothetical protein
MGSKALRYFLEKDGKLWLVPIMAKELDGVTLKVLYQGHKVPRTFSNVVQKLHMRILLLWNDNTTSAISLFISPCPNDADHDKDR